MGTPPPTPGWYPDPQNVQQRRYWDGAAWTEQTGPAVPGLSSLPAPSGPPLPPPETDTSAVAASNPKRSSGGAGCLIIIVGIVGFIAYAVISGGGSSSGPDDATAFINCQDAVRAYFRNPVDSHIKLSEADIRHTSTGWHITGPASAKNDFGVDKAFYYDCKTDADAIVTSATVVPQ